MVFTCKYSYQAYHEECPDFLGTLGTRKSAKERSRERLNRICRAVLYNASAWNVLEPAHRYLRSPRVRLDDLDTAILSMSFRAKAWQGWRRGRQDAQYSSISHRTRRDRGRILVCTGRYSLMLWVPYPALLRSILHATNLSMCGAWWTEKKRISQSCPKPVRRLLGQITVLLILEDLDLHKTKLKGFPLLLLTSSLHPLSLTTSQP